MRLAILIAFAAILIVCGNPAHAAHQEKRTDLDARYAEVNLRFFDGRLPRAALHFRDDLPSDEMAAISKQPDGTYLIYVRPDADLDYVLAHEGCHALTFDEQARHGQRWEACMRRFARKSAEYRASPH